jgi:hypothetical protein
LSITGERLHATRRVAVICIIVSLSLTALIGIATLLGGAFGDVQGRIMMTTLIIGAFSVLALADLAVAGRRFEWFGYVGILAAVAGLIIGLFFIWNLVDSGAGWWKTFGVVSVLAASLAHANLLLLLGERRRPVVRTGLWITIALIGVLAGMIVGLIVTDGDVSGDGYYRLLGTVAILDVLGTIVVPVVSRFLRDDGAAKGPSGGLTIALPDDLSARLSVLAAERAMPADAFVIKILEDLAGSRR